MQAVSIALVFFLLLVLAVSCLIPPFQSPDEFNHLKRAYLLSKGEIILKSTNNITGGEIDTGLLNYMVKFEGIPFKAEKKITNPENIFAEEIMWSGKKIFSGLPNTAMYFPVAYVPQALALFVGEQAGLRVHGTYRLARLFSLVAVIVMLWIAFLIYPVPLFVVALFITPMTLFQLGSASLDAVSYGLSVLVAALYMRGSDKSYEFNITMHVSLFFCLLVLATTRLNLIVLTPLPLILYSIRRDKKYLISALALIVMSSAWIAYIFMTVEGMPARELSAGGIISYYILNPGALLDVLFSTLRDNNVLSSYWYSFIGVLGWLDAPLNKSAYNIYALFLLVLALVSFQRTKSCLFSGANLFLSGCAVLSIIMLFMMILTGWMPHPARVMDGIQGRYFTPTIIILGFAIFNRRLSRIEHKSALVVIFLMAALSISIMPTTLLDRYWIGHDYSSYLNYDKRDGNYSREFNNEVQHLGQQEGACYSKWLWENNTGI